MDLITSLHDLAITQIQDWTWNVCHVVCAYPWAHGHHCNPYLPTVPCEYNSECLLSLGSSLLFSVQSVAYQNMKAEVEWWFSWHFLVMNSSLIVTYLTVKTLVQLDLIPWGHGFGLPWRACLHVIIKLLWHNSVFFQTCLTLAMKLLCALKLFCRRKRYIM